jgi:homopolymeric O-antigen transport system permease protein
MKTTAASAHAPLTTTISAKQIVSLRFYFQEVWRRRSLVRVLSGRELKRDYEMNVVGFAWWLLEPLSLTLVYVVVIDLIFNRGTPAYPLFIVTGVLPWKWFSQAVVGSMNTVRGNATLITDVYIPRALLPAVEIVTGLAHFLVGLAIIPIFMAVFHVGPTGYLLWLPVAMAVQFVLTLGLSFPLAVWGLYYRNLSGVAQNLLRLWFYLTPIIWPLARILDRPNFTLLVKLNPLTGIMDTYRGAFGDMTGEIIRRAGTTRVKLGNELVPHAPGWPLAYSLGVGVIGLLLGAWYFIHREQQFGKLI